MSTRGCSPVTGARPDLNGAAHQMHPEPSEIHRQAASMFFCWPTNALDLAKNDSDLPELVEKLAQFIAAWERKGAVSAQPTGVAQTPALDAILEALKPFAALGMPRGGAVDTARVDIWERANHGDTRVLLTSPSQQGGSVTLSTADFRAAHDALAATQQSPRLAEQLYRRVITKDRIYYEPATPQQSPRLEREAVARIICERLGYIDLSNMLPDGRERFLRTADAILALLSPDRAVVSSTDRGGK